MNLSGQLKTPTHRLKPNKSKINWLARLSLSERTSAIQSISTSLRYMSPTAYFQIFIIFSSRTSQSLNFDMHYLPFIVYGIIAIAFVTISCINYTLLLCGTTLMLDLLEYNAYNTPTLMLLLLLPIVSSPWYHPRLRLLFKHQLSVYHYLESGIRRSNLHTMDVAPSTRLANMLSLRNQSKSVSLQFTIVIWS